VAPGAREDPGGPLRAAAGVPVGAAVEPHLLQGDARHAPTLLREFGAITPESAMQWERVHPSAHFAVRDTLAAVRRAGARATPTGVS
jgi:hypothetical protein